MLQEVETSNSDIREISHRGTSEEDPRRTGGKRGKMVEDLLAKNIIRESESPWNAPIVCITKANGDMRLCVDYRQLNAVTLRPIYPAQLFDSLEGAKVFSVLDLSHDYYNVEVEETDRPKTAFATRRGQYEFNRMPFGLGSALATFQKLMHLILKNENWEQCLI